MSFACILSDQNSKPKPKLSWKKSTERDRGSTGKKLAGGGVETEKGLGVGGGGGGEVAIDCSKATLGWR